MVARQIGLVAALMLVIGCGETPKPATPGTSPAVATNDTKSTDPPAAAEKVDTPESQPETEPPFQLEDGFTALAFSDFEAFSSEGNAFFAKPLDVVAKNDSPP